MSHTYHFTLPCELCGEKYPFSHLEAPPRLCSVCYQDARAIVDAAMRALANATPVLPEVIRELVKVGARLRQP